MSIGIVTITHNPGEFLETFLGSIGEATAQPTEVIVVDNVSTDGAVEATLDRWPHVALRRLDHNVGYGSAANRAISQLTSNPEWIVVANPDIRFLPGSIDEMIRAANRYDRVGAVGPLIRSESGDIYPSARALPSIGLGAPHAVLSRVWPSNPWTKRYRRSTESTANERESEWLSGSCLALAREAFDGVGGFDEEYFMYFEDVDLGDRLRRDGWKNIYAVHAEVIHVGAHSTAHESRKMLRAHHTSAYRYLSRKYRAWYWYPVRLAVRIGLKLRFLVMSRGHPT